MVGVAYMLFTLSIPVCPAPPRPIIPPDKPK